MATFDFLHTRPIMLDDAIKGITLMHRDGNTHGLIVCLQEALEKAQNDYGYGSSEAIVIEALIDAL